MKVLFHRHRKYGKHVEKGGAVIHEAFDCLPGQVHELPESLKKNKFFAAHLKAGDCSIAPDAPAAEDQDESDGKPGKPQGKQGK